MTPSSLALHAVGLILIISAFWPACVPPHFDAQIKPGDTYHFSTGGDAPESRVECVPDKVSGGPSGIDDGTKNLAILEGPAINRSPGTGDFIEPKRDYSQAERPDSQAERPDSQAERPEKERTIPQATREAPTPSTLSLLGIGIALMLRKYR
jgi:hypothetical protein